MADKLGQLTSVSILFIPRKKQEISGQPAAGPDGAAAEGGRGRLCREAPRCAGLRSLARLPGDPFAPPLPSPPPSTPYSQAVAPLLCCYSCMQHHNSESFYYMLE